MPCNSTIPTKFMDQGVLVKAARNLGFTIESESETQVVIKHNDITLVLSRSNVNNPFVVQVSPSSYGFDEILDPLTIEYIEEKVRAFAKKTGYTLSRGKPKGKAKSQLVLRK